MKHSSTDQRDSKPAQIAKWIERYRASGLSLKQFAAAHQIPPGRLHYWIYQKQCHSSLAEGSLPGTFRELPLAELLGAASWAAEIRLPTGITVRVAASAAPVWIGAMVQQVAGSC